MGTIDEYLAGLEPADAAVVAQIYRVAAAAIGETEQGTGYGMPALTYRGKPLLSVMRTKKHIGVYPFSGRVPEAVAASLGDAEFDKGTIRFQPESPLSDEAVRAIVAARQAEIDATSR
ncbi:DUF1801 domain-containing protein [Microbacterium protaetiae]|uniref:DUF1801 domain-containing protein n=1 Tax=Microbacterium protaetiae TaxID=2509458 RepID=A0A4P6EE13_9MICO|nr:DUF1801 domain-containing protein [Microbacterium protaetiae]QAY60525.1 DUF1801 domain-containing protein [Microbacterium protaetiae]